MRPSAPAFLLPLLCLGLLASPAWGSGIYAYEDADGTITYTNEPPPKAKRARKLKGTFTAAPKKVDGARGPSTPTRAAKLDREDLNQAIAEAARRYDLPEPLLLAVMHTESYFNPTAVSSAGASGLMQLMPKTAEAMHVTDIFDVRQNIDGGARYLRVLANRFDGDMVKMLAAYNAGPEAVKRYGGKIPPYRETQAYVRKVVKLYFQYKQQAGQVSARGTPTPPPGTN